LARPLSSDKRKMILEAATRLFAEEGLNASTSRIAKAAGVSEGTIFTYFATKDELLNQLYLELKVQLRSTLALPEPVTDLKQKVELAWKTYIRNGLERPETYQVMAKLYLSTRITEETRAAGAKAFCDVIGLLEEAKTGGVLQNQPAEFVGSLLASMANSTMDFMQKNPGRAEEICRDAFTAFWSAVAAR